MLKAVPIYLFQYVFNIKCDTCLYLSNGVCIELQRWVNKHIPPAENKN